VTYLKNLESLREVDVLRMVHHIAKGMAYLHSKGVLHGDLKVNDTPLCRAYRAVEPFYYRAPTSW
jgi:serine/threonine protein kinase